MNPGRYFRIIIWQLYVLVLFAELLPLIGNCPMRRSPVDGVFESRIHGTSSLFPDSDRRRTLIHDFRMVSAYELTFYETTGNAVDDVTVDLAVPIDGVALAGKVFVFGMNMEGMH